MAVTGSVVAGVAVTVFTRVEAGEGRCGVEVVDAGEDDEEEKDVAVDEEEEAGAETMIVVEGREGVTKEK